MEDGEVEYTFVKMDEQRARWVVPRVYRPPRDLCRYLDACFITESAPVRSPHERVRRMPEGATYICGTSPSPDRDADDLPLDEVDHTLFDDVIWPTLAHRVPQFEALRVEHAWSGYYEYNVFDHNAIIGYHPDIDNCVFANGFSGHGLQQGPATGRGVAELILQGRFVSLDLSPLGFARVLENRPVIERNVV